MATKCRCGSLHNKLKEQNNHLESSKSSCLLSQTGNIFSVESTLTFTRPHGEAVRHSTRGMEESTHLTDNEENSKTHR